MAFAFLRRLLGLGDGSSSGGVMQIFTPQAAGNAGAGTKLILAGATAAGLVVAGLTALTSLLVLFAALAAIYYLLTEVLGLRLDVDPAAFVQQAQRYAQSARN
jgi:hypothetical protein